MSDYRDADFTPQLGNYRTLQPFRYWCQKVLPLVYDDSLSYYELLCKVVDYLNKTMEDVETLHGDVTNLHTAYEELQSYVNNYFSTLDVQEEINNKLDNMASSGELYEIIRKYTDPIVNEQNEQINVLKARMDTFASLPNGSTKGDAELTDIRVGYDGKVYPSAGDAVRGQASELNNYLVNNIENVNSLFPVAMKIGTYTTDGNSLTYVPYPNSICGVESFVTKEKPVRVVADSGFQFFLITNKNGIWTAGPWTTNSKIPPNTEVMPVIRKADVTKGNIEYKNNVHCDSELTASVKEAVKVFPYLIEASNYSVYLPNLDNANGNAKYFLNFGRGVSSLPLNTPWAEYPYGLPSMLETHDVTFSSTSNVGTCQIIYGAYGDIWKRERKISKWGDWKCINGATIIVGKDGKDFERIVDAVNVTRFIPNTTIYVEKGFYDILAELKAIYPTFFSKYDKNHIHGRGLFIGNGSKWIFSSDAVVLCNYTGGDVNFTDNFSPFMIAPSDCYIDGLYCRCSNVRYAIHDDPLKGKDNRWNHVYKNMNIAVNNSNSPKSYRACIGGGLGQSSTIVVEDSVFESAGVANNNGIVSYHNVILDDAMSFVTIKNNYFRNGTIRASYYGPSTKVSRFLVSNNVVKSEPFVAREVSDYNTVNVEMLKWNNVIA